MKRIMKRIVERRHLGHLGHLGLAVICLVATGCSLLLTDAFEYGTVEVTAQTDSGEPIPGVGMLLYSGTRHLATGDTDESGRFVFTFVPEGDLGVHSTWPADVQEPDPSYQTFRMREGESHSVIFTIEVCVGTGSIFVRTVDEDGAPVGDVHLNLYDPHEILEDVRTDAGGTYDFFDVPCGGPYGVQLAPPGGYEVDPGPGGRYIDALFIEDGTVHELVFVLNRAD